MAARRHPLEKVLGHRFANPELLEQALTHRSALSGRSKKQSAVDGNERLEFLGDRVLGLATAEALIAAFPDEEEGQLARRLAALVSAPTLAKVATACDIGAHIKSAPGARDQYNAVLADACEAVIAALYLDGGLDAARAFITAQWSPLMNAAVEAPKDAKTALQEWAQGKGLPLPAYREISSAGPAHAPSFVMAVKVEGYPEVQGQGRTKRIATQAAATALLDTLK